MALAASGVSREELYVTTKLWPGNPDWNQPPKSFEQTVECCEASVRKLGLERCDLYLIHTPLGGGKEGRLAQYRGLVECQKRGLCTSIGVSNYGVAHLEEIAAEGLPLPAANQLELHPMSQKAADPAPLQNPQGIQTRGHIKILEFGGFTHQGSQIRRKTLGPAK